MESKVVSLLGLCRKAGKCACGSSAAEFSVKRGKCKLVFIANDSGRSTRDMFVHLCEENNIKYVTAFDKSQLGMAVGLKEKAVIGISDQGFADGLCKALNIENTEA